MPPGALAVALLGALLPWRDDGRCGEHFPAPDGTRVSRCDPWDADASCCSAEGVCGVGDEFCQFDGCIDYSIRQDWRSDGQCGPEVTGADGSSPATCHPLDRNNGTCCSDAGWCGRSAAHCRCRTCVDYYRACNCASPDAPCIDARTGLCYPRIEVPSPDATYTDADDIVFSLTKREPTHDSSGEPMDPRNSGQYMDRPPDQDPKLTMKEQAIRQGIAYERKLFGTEPMLIALLNS